jgi:hypothetical protein
MKTNNYKNGIRDGVEAVSLKSMDKNMGISEKSFYKNVKAVVLKDGIEPFHLNN